MEELFFKNQYTAVPVTDSVVCDGNKSTFADNNGKGGNDIPGWGCICGLLSRYSVGKHDHQKLLFHRMLIHLSRLVFLDR